MINEELLMHTVANCIVQEARISMISEIVSRLVETNPHVRDEISKELPSVHLETMGMFDNFDCGDQVVNKKVAELAKQIYSQQPFDF